MVVTPSPERLINEIDQAIKQYRELAASDPGSARFYQEIVSMLVTWHEIAAFGEATRKTRAEEANALCRYIADRGG